MQPQKVIEIKRDAWRTRRRRLFNHKMTCSGPWQPSTASSEATTYSRLEKIPHFLLAPFSEETFALRRGRKTKTRTKSDTTALPGVRAERRFVERKEHFAFEAPLGPVVELQDRLSKG
jgi:hypothetical protein